LPLVFAGAIKEVGLPKTDIVLSVIFVNIDVKVGQLLFVSVVLLLSWIFRSLINKHTYSMSKKSKFIL